MLGIQQKKALKVTFDSQGRFADNIVVEEPLEIRIWDYETAAYFPLTITMRTPGEDIALAKGFLFAEGIIGSDEDIVNIEQPAIHTLLVRLHKAIAVRDLVQNRNFSSTASCGLCGKTKMQLMDRHSCYFPAKDQPVVQLDLLLQLPKKLSAEQSLFQLTGGIHAAGLFNSTGELIELQEDIGRHNALDKLIGKSLAASSIPWRDHMLVLSGRIGFELVQKASMLGIPIVLAVGAPSSLAIQIAEEHGITLIGFTKADRCNIYTGEERIITRLANLYQG